MQSFRQKKMRLTLLGVIVGGVTGLLLAWVFLASESGAPQAPVSTECLATTQLSEGEFIVGRPGVYLKVGVDGALTQATGEELSRVRRVFGLNADDEEIALTMECGSNVETGEASWFTSSVPMERLFSTRAGTRMQLEITEGDQRQFQESIQLSCPEPCEPAKLIAISDLNDNGKKEYWFLEPETYDMGVGVIEEPDQRILSVCPGCPD
jgi:hypothetical protein